MGMELAQDPASRGLTDEEIIQIPGLHSRWVRLANGARAHYVTSGETGPAIILLHGGIVGSSGTAGWRFMAPFLGANGFRVFCPDQPAFGWADTSPEYYPLNGIKSYVDFVEMFADALCLDKFHVAGNSMGCQHTVHYTISHPDRVLSFVMIATGGLSDLTEGMTPVARKDGRFTANPNYEGIPFDGTEKSMRDLMAGIIYKAEAVWPELVTMRTKAALRQANSTAARMARNRDLAADPNYLQWLRVKDRLPRLTLPGIYLYGLNDVLNPVETAFNQEDRVPNIQVFYPDQCGHQGQTDQPEMFNQVFLEFFRDGKISWKTAEWAGVSRRRAINPDRVEAPTGGLPAPDPGRYASYDALRAAQAKVAV
jgi:2-hydroxy-6-oxonona-2,4-dienedioate hydrolase